MSLRRVDRAVADYTALRPRLLPATDEFVALVTGTIDDAGINYLSVTGRTKAIGSFAAKARGVLADDSSADPLRAVTDQVGVRVITYVQRDIDAVAGLLAEQFTVLDDRDLGEETARAGRFGYASRHLLVSRAPGAPTAYDPLFCASIQLRTVLQHAWAEFEHDIRYKGTVPPEQVPDLDRRFTLAAGLLELADREFEAIRDRLQAGLGDSAVDGGDEHDPRISAQELATFLAGRYSNAGLVEDRALRVDLRAAARARHRLARRAGLDVARRRQRRGHRGDGLPLPARCGAPARRRPALALRRDLRGPARQRPPPRVAGVPPLAPARLSRGASDGTSGGHPPRLSAAHLTSARRTMNSPIASGRRNHRVPETARCCHCSLVTLPLNSMLRASA